MSCSSSPTLPERYRGALLGLATGDAVGTTLEFKSPGSFTPITDMVGGGPFHLQPGEWTDDTTMALCLAESLVERQGFDAHDQMERYVAWMRHGKFSVKGYCFDIGNTTAGALHRFEQTRNPYAGSTDSHTAGNGSIMRLAPVALMYAQYPPIAIARCADSSRTTHGATTAVDACRYLSALLVGVLNSATREEVLAPHYSPVPGYWAAHPLHPEIDAIAQGSFKVRQPPQIRGTGYVVQSLWRSRLALYDTLTGLADRLLVLAQNIQREA